MQFCSRRFAVFLSLTALVGGVLGHVHAQEAIEFSTEQIQAKLAAVEASTELDETKRAPIIESYKRTLVELASKASLEDQLAKVQQEITDVPSRIEKTQFEIEELGKAKAALEPDIENAIGLLASVKQDTAIWLQRATQILEQIEARRNEQQTLLDNERKTLASLQGEPKRRADRRVEVPSFVLSLQDRIKSFKTEAAALASSDDLAQVIEARQFLLRAQQAHVQTEMDVARKEVELYDRAATLLPLRVDSAQRKVSQLEQTVKLYGAEADRLRKSINSIQARTAASEASARPAELNLLAQENVDLIAKRQEVGAAIETTRQYLEATVKLGSQLREQFERIQLQIGPTAQVTEAVGQILRKNRQDLPNVRKLREASEARKTKLYDIRFALIDSEQQLWPLLDMDSKTESELELLALEVPAGRLKELEPDLRELLQAKKSALEGLKTDLETHYRELANLDFQGDQLIALTESYAEFVDQRVMWIRSVPRLSLSDITDTGNSIRWLLDTTSWTTLLRSYWEAGIRRHPFINALFVIALLGLAGTRRSNREQIADLGLSAESHLCCDIRITVYAIIRSVIYASFWPALLAWISWNLYQVGNGSELVRPLAIATGATAFIIFPYELWRSILKPGGLAEAHFRWPQRRMKLLRRSLHCFMPVWISLIFLFHVLHATENLVYEKSLARLVFLASCVVLTVFVHRLVSPKSGFLKEYLALNRGGWLDQLRWLWHPLMVGVPVVVGILAILGYQYTAAHLLRRFSISAAFLSVVYIGSAAGLRWIMLRRRAISIEHLRKKASESKQTGADRTQATDSVGGVTLTENLDLSTVSA